MRFLGHIAFAGVSLMALSAPAFGQEAPADEVASAEDIIVQARRKDESLQDVPLTVNAVSAATIDKLNIRDLKDISSVVPGLILAPGNRTTGAIVALRGLNVDNTASGNNGTVQFYLNDAPISGGAVLQALYDIGQIEVLRGPQGTLRGVASPSGSITVTTRRPDMEEWGGYVQGTVTNLDGANAQGAINVPVIPGVLAFRFAGVFENNDGSRVRSITAPNVEPSSKSRGVRASVRLTPTPSLEFNASYNHLVRDAIVWDQVESLGIALGTPVIGAPITGRDRLAVSDLPQVNHYGFDIFNWQAKWSFAGQRLDYVGSFTKQDLNNRDPQDKGNYFDASFPATPALPARNPQNAYSGSHTFTEQTTHELRLSSEERLFGFLNYTVGGMINKLRPWTDLDSFRSVNFSTGGTPTPATYVSTTVAPPLLRRGRSIERSFFGNLTAYVGERTEISGGLRHINYRENTSSNNGPDNIFNAWIWSASAKHRFSDDFMAYASAGSSWRVGSGSNPLILLNSQIGGPIVDPYLQTFSVTQPERSKSYEIGFKSSLFDKRVTLNVSAFHQDFTGYIYSSSTGIFVLNNTGTTAAPAFAAPRRLIAGLAASVPAKIDGVEVELAFRANENFNASFNMAYAKSKMSGNLPCNPIATGPGGTTTVADVQQGVPNRQIAQCAVDQSASRNAPFSANVQAEYSRLISGEIKGFVRGLLNITGNSKNDPTNPYDDVSAYALFNLYAGVRAEDGRWEVTAYGKNLFNTYRVLSRDAFATGITVGDTSGGGAPVTRTVSSNYRLISSTEPREFGLTAKFAFGSR